MILTHLGFIIRIEWHIIMVTQDEESQLKLKKSKIPSEYANGFDNHQSVRIE